MRRTRSVGSQRLLLRALDVDPPADPLRFSEAVDAFRQRVPVTRAEWDAMTAVEQRRAFTVANVAQADVVENVWAALDQAIEKGETIETFKARIGDVLDGAWGEDGSGVERLFRTSIAEAYSDGREEQRQDPAVLSRRPYNRFDAIEDGAICPVCGDLDRTILPADDPFWDTSQPPLHPNCRCEIVALSGEEAADEGYEADDEAPDSAPAAPGFGLAADERPDWIPDTSDYPQPLREILDERLSVAAAAVRSRP